MRADETHSVAAASAERAAGTLTFLFTDVEGSTPLWERHEATMRAVAARHDALLDAVITQHRGRRVRERGGGDRRAAGPALPAADRRQPERASAAADFAGDRRLVL